MVCMDASKRVTLKNCTFFGNNLKRLQQRDIVQNGDALAYLTDERHTKLLKIALDFQRLFVLFCPSYHELQEGISKLQ